MHSQTIEDLRKTYKIGIEAIDEQHKEWLEIFAEMLSLSGDYQNLNLEKQEEFKLVVVKMYRYARKHLKYEEAFMENINYPNIEAHKIEHKTLDSMISGYFASMMNDELSSCSDLLEKVEKWLIIHIMGSDKQFAQYAKDNDIDVKSMLPEIEF